MSAILWTTFAVLAAYLVARFVWHNTYWQRQGVPCYPWISIGWASQPIHRWLEKLNVYGRIYGLYTGHTYVLVVNDARVAREISARDLPKFASRGFQYFGNSSVTRSLFFLPADEDWKRIRSIVTPAFTSGKLRDMCQPIETILDKFIHNLKKEADTGKEFNIKLYCDSMAMDVIARCGYGIDVDSLSDPNHPVVVNARKILGIDASLSMVLCFTIPSLARLLKLEAFDWRATQYFDNLTKSIVEKRIETNSVRNSKDLIGLMLQSSNEMDINNNNNNNNHKNEDASKLKNISMTEIQAQSVLFFIAGYDTTNTTLSHALYYLTKYPQWQERLHQEIEANEGKLDYEHLKTLSVLNGIINETLRLNPPLMIFNRESVVDTYLGDTGIFVPAGTIISIQPYIIHRDPEYFPEPDCFKPERFIDGEAESSPAFMPFGVGQRLCVGMRFALNELRLVLAQFVKHYRLEANEHLELEYFNGNILMSPKNVKVKIGART